MEQLKFHKFSDIERNSIQLEICNFMRMQHQYGVTNYRDLNKSLIGLNINEFAIDNNDNNDDNEKAESIKIDNRIICNIFIVILSWILFMFIMFNVITYYEKNNSVPLEVFPRSILSRRFNEMH